MLMLAGLAAALATAGAGAAPPPAAGPPHAVSCVSVQRTGSMLSHRVCHTEADWARLRAERAAICGAAVTNARQHCDVQLTSEGEQVVTRTR